jgi:hypothetical protein
MKISSASLSVLLAGGLLFAGTVAATEPTVTIVKPVKSDAASSRKVARDATTGKLRPTTEAEDAELEAAAASQRGANNGVLVVNRPSASVARLPSGAVVAKRTVEDLEQLIAVKTTDGKLQIDHASSRSTPKASNTAVEK